MPQAVMDDRSQNEDEVHGEFRLNNVGVFTLSGSGGGRTGGTTRMSAGLKHDSGAWRFLLISGTAAAGADETAMSACTSTTALSLTCDTRLADCLATR